MATMLRLTRMGRKKRPFYRIVAIDKRTRRDGKYIEKLGHYDPTTEPVTLVVDHDIALKWLKVGAQMSDTVKRLFTRDGVLLRRELVAEGKDQPEIEEKVKAHQEKNNPQPKPKGKYVPKEIEPVEPPKSKEEIAKEEAEAKAKAEAEAKAKEEAEAKDKGDDKADEPKDEAKSEEKAEDSRADESAKDEPKADEAKKDEAKADEGKDEEKKEG